MDDEDTKKTISVSLSTNQKPETAAAPAVDYSLTLPSPTEKDFYFLSGSAHCAEQVLEDLTPVSRS